MKHEPMDAEEYPDLIQAEAKGGKIVEYLRIDVVRARELALLEACACSSEAGSIYKNAGLKELK